MPKKLYKILASNYIPLILFLFTFIIYVHNLSPYVYGGDVGDFLTAVAVKGVPHPSGYPLFTLFGILFSYLPFNTTLAYKVGMVSSLFASLTVVLMYLTSLLLTKNKLISIITSLTLAFSYVFWLYAEVAEVFAMGAFFFMLLTYLALKYYFKPSKKLLYLLAFSTGLSLSHHLMIMAIFPSVLLLVLRSNWKIILDYKLIIKCILLLILGLVPYIYIPIAASFDPLHSWDNAKNLPNFIRLVTRADYKWTPSVNVFKETLHVKLSSVIYYFTEIINSLFLITAIIAISGIFTLIIQKRYILLFGLFINFFLLGPFFVFYGAGVETAHILMGVVERFYVFSIIFVVIFCSYGYFGISLLWKKFLNKYHLKKFSKYDYLILIPFLSIPLFLLLVNFARTDLRFAKVGENYAKDILNTLPKNAILLSKGDTTTFNLLYLQHSKKYRTDVLVLSIHRPDKNKYFVDKVNLDYSVITNKTYLKLLNSLPDFVLSEYKKRPIYAINNVTLRLSKNIQPKWIQFGLVNKLELENKKFPQDIYLNIAQNLWNSYSYAAFDKLSIAEKNSKTLYSAQYMYGLAASYTGQYIYYNYHNSNATQKYFELATRIIPYESIGYSGLTLLYKESGQCQKAEKIYFKLLMEVGREPTTYINLYNLYKDCFKDKDKMIKIEKEYRDYFGVPIFKNKEK